MIDGDNERERSHSKCGIEIITVVAVILVTLHHTYNDDSGVAPEIFTLLVLS